MARPVGDTSAKKQEILQAAKKLIAENGIAAVTIKDIAREIGSTTGLVTYYFDNKDHIITSVKDMAFDEIASALTDIYDVDDPVEKLSKAVQAILPLTDERAQTWMVYVQYLPDGLRNQSVKNSQAHRGRRWVHRFETILLELRSAKRLKPFINPGDAARMITLFIEGLSINAVTDPEEYPGSVQVAQSEQLLQFLLQNNQTSTPVEA